MIFSICHKTGLSREESFDIFGQVCSVLVTSIDKLHSPDKVLSYVTTITRRQIGELLRRARMFDVLSEEALSSFPDHDAEPPDRLLEMSRRCERLNRALARLPRRDYELISALFLEGSVSYEELAERLHMPVSSIGPTRARTLRKLQRLLQQQESSSKGDGKRNLKHRQADGKE
jgi:RNA polymerase sigma factor (sigma-70 family)